MFEVSFIYGEELDFKKKKESDAKDNVPLFKLSNNFNMKEKDSAIKMHTQRIRNYLMTFYQIDTWRKNYFLTS